MIEPPGPPSIVMQIHSNTDAEVLMLIENLILYWVLAYKVRVFVEKPIVWLERSGEGTGVRCHYKDWSLYLPRGQRHGAWGPLLFLLQPEWKSAKGH